jgi:hypothetical protein
MAFHIATSFCGAPGESSGNLLPSSMTKAEAPTALSVDTFGEVNPDIIERHLETMGAEEPKGVPIVIYNMLLPLSVPVLVIRPRFASGLIVDPFTDLSNDPLRAYGTKPCTTHTIITHSSSEHLRISISPLEGDVNCLLTSPCGC